MKIGILGGTFDPVHIGHLIIAEECLDVFHLDKVSFIPAKMPPHKLEKKISSEYHRLKMLEIAVKDNSKFDICKCELTRPGPSYTIDTLKNFQPSDEIYLLMGQDSFLAIETWHKYLQLFEYSRVVVVNRPGVDSLSSEHFSPEIKKFLNRDVIEFCDGDYFLNSGKWKVCFLAVPSVDVSSSMIRDRIRANRSIRYLVPSEIERYIRSHMLYHH